MGESGVRRTAVSGRYVSEEQRSQPGCSAARMQPECATGCSAYPSGSTDTTMESR